MIFTMKKSLLLIVSLLVIAGTLGGQCCSKSESQCCNPWKFIYEVDSNGGHVSGNKYALLAAILAGSRVRVSIGDYFAEADGVYVHGDHAHAELIQHVSKANWKHFQNDAYWWWTMLATTGHMYNIRYNVGSHQSRGDTTTKQASKWFIKSAYYQNCPVYSNNKAGQATSGNLQDLKNAVQSGKEIRAITGKSYNFPLQNIAFDSAKVAGQFLDHVSKKTSGVTISYQSNAYWWFTMISTSGKRDMSRWSVGSHVDRGHTQDTVDTEWFKDDCWELVYSHDGSGKATKGTLNDLILAVQSGKRIRFQFPGSAHYTAEADNLSIRNGHVTAQALKHVSKASLEKFQDNAYWYWLMVSSTGTVRETRYNVGSHVSRGESKGKRPITWFAETRDWKLAFINDKNGGLRYGSKSTIINAVRQGASVRIVNDDGAYAFPAQNLAIHGGDVAAQTVNHVSMMSASDSVYEVAIQPNAYWWFTIVTTQGERDMSRWTVGSHQNRGRSQDRVAMRWFIQQ